MRAGWALALIWTLTVPACSQRSIPVSQFPQLVQRAEPVISWVFLDSLAGVAYGDCEISPTAWVRVHARGIDLAMFDSTGGIYLTPDLMETVAHELAHVRQMEALGCAEWMRVMSDPTGRANIEETASCVALWIVRRYRCGD